MANRSYLYSTDRIPQPNQDTGNQKIVGIAEYNYDIPIVFKVLLSGHPQACLSVIWENTEPVAIAGDYAIGVQNLEAFLAKITLPNAQEAITEALTFLKLPENQNQYFILECGEIFEMSETPIVAQNMTLLQQIKNRQSEEDAALQTLLPPVSDPKPVRKPGFFATLFGRKAKPVPITEPTQALYDLGLGTWSNILYFDFSENNASL